MINFLQSGRGIFGMRNGDTMMNRKLILAVILAALSGSKNTALFAQEYATVTALIKGPPRSCHYRGAPPGASTQGAEQECTGGDDAQEVLVPKKGAVEIIVSTMLDPLKNQLNQLKNDQLPNQKKELEIYVTEQLKDIKAGSIEAALVEILSDPKRREKLLPLLAPDIAKLNEKIETLKKEVDAIKSLKN